MFYKWQLAIFAFFWFIFGIPDAWGINLSSIYYSSCQRDIGVIIDVDETQLHMITLQGKIKRVPRFDIIYIAYYPVGFTPIDAIEDPQEISIITVKTIHQNEIVELVKGWMIDYSQEQISFLTIQGFETVVDINDIWDIEIGPVTDALKFKNKFDFQYRFIHPYPFSHCPDDGGATTDAEATTREKANTIYPEILLGDPLMIKKELDRLEEGHQRITDYQESKSYYPVPQVYTNDTILGVWMNGGSRYGASGNRTNNFIPFLRSESSDGPFGFQRVWITGAAPMTYSLQEEVQTQLYYRLKADYLHFSIMYDIARTIMGESKYRWLKEDLEEFDDRLNEIFHIGGGFDRGGYNFGYTFTRAQYGIRVDDLFFFNRANIHKFDLTYHHRLFKIDFFHAFASDRKPGIQEVAEGQTEEDIQKAEEILAAIPEFLGDFRIFRLNVEIFSFDDFQFLYSFIYRKLDFARKNNLEGFGQFNYLSKSITNVLYLGFPLGSDLTLSTFFSLENHSNWFDSDGIFGESTRTFPKAGVGITLKI